MCRDFAASMAEGWPHGGQAIMSFYEMASFFTT